MVQKEFDKNTTCTKCNGFFFQKIVSLVCGNCVHFSPLKSFRVAVFLMSPGSSSSGSLTGLPSPLCSHSRSKRGVKVLVVNIVFVTI